VGACSLTSVEHNSEQVAGGREAHAEAGKTGPATQHRKSAQISMRMETDGMWKLAVLLALHAMSGKLTKTLVLPCSRQDSTT
jgi:hypothetical protein